MMSQIHPDFLSSATSAVAVDNAVLTGRPYGGTANLFKQCLANIVSIVDTNEPRMTAILIRTGHGPVLLVNVYMPTDYGTCDCVEEHLDVCTKINVLFSESEAAFLIVIGDFNCKYGVSSRFHDNFKQLMCDNHLVCSDVRRLVDAFSYCGCNGMHTTWMMIMKMMMMTMNWLSPVTAYIARSTLDVATCKRSEKRGNAQVYLMRFLEVIHSSSSLKASWKQKEL